MAMQLKSFQAKHFRSVDDSGIIETDAVTALIGINESGKSNLLLPLWKLKPAKGGEIKPTADFPRKSYNDLRSAKEKPDFIEAIFMPDAKLAQELATLTSSKPEYFEEVRVGRKLDSSHWADFPKSPRARSVEKARMAALLANAKKEIGSLTALKAEEDAVASIKAAMGKAESLLPGEQSVGAEQVQAISAALPAIEVGAKTSAIGPRYGQLREEIAAVVSEVSQALPHASQEARNLAWKHVPSFVYYTNYGNLDSEIYLPHVIENMAREGLGSKEEAKVRTLKVLFEFVGLKPSEILELGRDFKAPAATPTRQPTSEEIAAIAEKKKERSILLQSASTKLTQEFRSWWKQGEYRFRFEADGDHFRIWVSDDKRPEEIELEGRSTGLQWFLSFYLVFLVESRDAHAGALLLLDEPGTSLHPLAQKDLSAFFDGLAQSNQLIYTTHSPFLIDADRLDRARKVYVATDGTTKSTPDLRAPESDKVQRASGYAVHAALGLTIAEGLLLGCTTVVVEGISDQIYLSAVKNLLIGQGKITPSRELVFPPAGGAKGVKVVASLLTGRDEILPVVLFDSDPAGQAVIKQLLSSLYVDAKHRVLEVGKFTGVADSEIEDLIPADIVTQAIDRWQRAPEQAFADAYQSGKPIISQIEQWAKSHQVELVAPAWKVELAKRAKQILLSRSPAQIPQSFWEMWVKLFTSFQV